MHNGEKLHYSTIQCVILDVSYLKPVTDSNEICYWAYTKSCHTNLILVHRNEV